MSSLGIVHYPRDNMDPKKKWIQLTDMCFPFSKQQADVVSSAAAAYAAAAYRAETPPIMSAADMTAFDV